MKTLLAAALITVLSAGYANAHGLADRIDEARTFPNQTVATASPEEQCELAAKAEQRPVVASTHALQDWQKMAMHSRDSHKLSDMK